MSSLRYTKRDSLLWWMEYIKKKWVIRILRNGHLKQPRPLSCFEVMKSTKKNEMKVERKTQLVLEAI